MAAVRTNPFRDPVPYNRVRLGGRLILAVLTKFNGLKIEDGWKVDKGKSSSGGTAKFTGTKLVGGEKGFTLTFRCAGPGEPVEAAARAYDDLRELYDLMAPQPGQGGGTTATAATGQTSAVGSPPAPTTGFALPGAPGTTPAATSQAFTAAESSFGAGGDKKDKDPDPGPRPPTLPIEFAPCANLGVFAVARASWEEKYVEDQLIWDIEIGLVVDKPTTPAGAGVMAAPKPAATGGGSPPATASAEAAANAAAQAEAAGT